MATGSTKPSILIVSTAYFPFVGGAETAIAEITARLSRQYHFELWCAKLRPGVRSREHIGSVSVRRFGMGTRLDKFIFLPIISFFVMTRSRKPELIWGMDISQGALVGAVLSRIFRVPFVLTIQYGYGSERLARGRAGAIGASFRFMLRRAAHVTVISSHLGELARAFGYKGPLSVIPNGVNLARITYHESRIKERSEPWIIITTSRLVRKNGIDILVRAAKELKTIIPDTEYVIRIIGSGPEEKKLKKLARELRVEDVVEFVGGVPYEQIPAELVGADIFVRPSRSEGLGISFLEAMAAGLPIVGTPVGGIPDFLKDPSTGSGQATGLFCKVEDPSDLARKIALLTSSEGLYGRLSKNGYELVRSKYSWDGVAEKMDKIFQQCASL
jgi:glycosyltransferase involved in cell wall biosynthesis